MALFSCFSDRGINVDDLVIVFEKNIKQLIKH